jgi:hypothetical protein
VEGASTKTNDGNNGGGRDPPQNTWPFDCKTRALSSGALATLFDALWLLLFPWLREETAILKLTGSTCKPLPDGMANLPRVAVEASIKEYLSYRIGPAGDAHYMIIAGPTALASPPPS